MWTSSQAIIEFRGLQQGSMSISEYEARFHELVGRTSIIFPSNLEQAQRFVDGLILPLRLALEPLVAVGHSFT